MSFGQLDFWIISDITYKSRRCEYNALHDYVCEKIGDSKEQFYLFFDDVFRPIRFLDYIRYNL